MSSNEAPADELETQMACDLYQWQLIDDFECWKQPGLNLRISYEHLHHEDGTSSYANLELWAASSYTTLKSVQFVSRGERLLPTDEAIQELKDYAALLSADG